jgi:hypothetical protein
LSFHSSNSTLVLFCLVTLLNYRFQALQFHHTVLRSNRQEHNIDIRLFGANFQSSSTMSAALRNINNKRKPAKLSKSSESDVQDSRNSSPKSAAKKPRTRLRSSSPTVESQPGPSSTPAPSILEVTTSVASQDQVISLVSTSQAAGATLASQPADSSMKHAPVLHATSSAISSAIDTTSVASNTLLVAPVVNNNPLTITPSHGRYGIYYRFDLRSAS